MARVFVNVKEPRRTTVLLSLWILGSLIIYFVLCEFLDYSAEHFFLVCLAGLGFFLYFHRPLEIWGYSRSADTGAQIVVGCLIFVYSVAFLVVPNVSQETNETLCESNSSQMRCYRLPFTACKTFYGKFENDCAIEIKKGLGDRVTALIGPAVKKCAQKKYDKSFYYTRKNQSSSECKSFFQTLKN